MVLFVVVFICLIDDTNALWDNVTKFVSHLCKDNYINFFSNHKVAPQLQQWSWGVMEIKFIPPTEVVNYYQMGLTSFKPVSNLVSV